MLKKTLVGDSARFSILKISDFPAQSEGFSVQEALAGGLAWFFSPTENKTAESARIKSSLEDLNPGSCRKNTKRTVIDCIFIRYN